MGFVLHGENGNEFELSFETEELADLQDDGHDAEYVNVVFNVGTAEGSFEETAPSMNIYELKNLLEWLEGLTGRGQEPGEIEFLEPNLKFSVEEEGEEDLTLRIGFHLEDRPEWARIDAPTDELGYIDLKLSRDQVSAAAADLREDLIGL